MEIEENLPFLNGVSEHSNRKFEVGGSNLMFNCCKELGALLLKYTDTGKQQFCYTPR